MGMTIKTRLPLFILLLLSLSALFSVAVLSNEDPELRRWGEDEEEEEFSREERGGSGGDPYVFEKHEFVTKVETKHGRVGVLPRFGMRSKLLRGIDDFRLGFLDIDPHALLVLHHFDADSLLFVVEGHGTFVILKEDKKDHVNFEEGDVVRIRAGSPVYLLNGDSNKRLRIAILLKPVNVPGHVELYQGTSGEDRSSFYSAFSLDVLEAALKTDRQSLEELFGQQQQQQPAVVMASKEQIEALTGRGSSNSSHAFNIFNMNPSKSNQFGQLREVDANDFITLKDLDVRVTFVNITQGAMIGPYFNSRASVISIVTKGKGHLEMACPHLTSTKLHRHNQHGRYSQGKNKYGQGESRTYQRRHEQREGQTYETVWSRVEQGMVFIVPAGHPVVSLASENDNLEILFYEVNAENNVRYPLAGKNNIISLMDKEAKELTFDFPSREVNRVFNNQEEELFFSGPSRRQQERRGLATT